MRWKAKDTLQNSENVSGRSIKSYAAFNPKEPLRPFQYQSPPLAPHEILIKISHCGLCHSDIHLIDDNWKRSRYPLVPGHEIVGTLEEKGSAVENFQIGQRLGVSWIRSACLHCPTCLSGDTNICPKKTSTCNGSYGGFASYMTADSRFVYAIPDSLDSALAAPLLCAGATVYAPLRRENPRSAAVVGIGGLGHLALQFGAAMGCEMTALSQSPSKKEEALSFGASRFFTLDTLPTLPGPQFDLVLSTVHADLDWNALLSLLKPQGTLAFLGRPPSPAQIDIAQLLSYQRKITGSSNSSRALLNEMLQFAARHRIHPKIERFPLAAVNEAIDKVKANAVRYRAVLEI